jgi:hypothetical protein
MEVEADSRPNEKPEPTRTRRLAKCKPQPTSISPYAQELPYYLLLNHAKRTEFMKLTEEIFGPESSAIITHKMGATMPTETGDVLDVEDGKSVPVFNAGALAVIRAAFADPLIGPTPTPAQMVQIVADAQIHDPDTVTVDKVRRSFAQKRYYEKVKAERAQQRAQQQNALSVRTRILKSGKIVRDGAGPHCEKVDMPNFFAGD